MSLPLCAILLHVYLAQSCFSLPLDEFYPYGKDFVTSLPRNDDGNSAEITITTTFPFFDKQFNSLYVNTNGGISFGAPVTQYTPNPFPLGDGRVIIAPFWADVDIRQQGEVLYNPMTLPEILENATQDVRNSFPKFKQFIATWTFVATWYKVPFYGRQIGNANVNTFQAVLITNGRYSFVRFNYHEITWTSGTASGGNSSGLGGVQPECGFNAGDGNSSYSITKPDNLSVFDLPRLTNVQNAKPGMWMFRIDNAEIQGSGCSNSGFLTFRPNDYEVIMFGGLNIKIYGPCFRKADKILCRFDGGKTTPGIFKSKISVQCTVPMVHFIGKANVALSRDNGKTFPYHGTFFYVSMQERKRQTFIRTNWTSNGLNIVWNPHPLQTQEDTQLQIARFVFKNGTATFHSFYNVSDDNRKLQADAKPPPITEDVLIDKKEVEGSNRRRFVSFLRIIKKDLFKPKPESSHEWLWSKVISHSIASSKTSVDLCKKWVDEQPDPTILNDDELLSCPPTEEKAKEDSGRYTKSNEVYLQFLKEKDSSTCYITITPSLKNYGQRCCYNKMGNLVIGYKDKGGSLQRVHSEAGYPYISHYFHDVLPYQDCCYWPLHSCELYYKKRPSNDGTNYTPPRPAATFGEPHMITLDGVQYTFNGYGEFVILNISRDAFMLQGRMEQLKPVNGTPINATVYTAFAMKSLESDLVQIEMKEFGGVNVAMNGNTRNFDSDGIILFSNGFIENKHNTSKYSITFRNGVKVNVEDETLLLQLMVSVPDKFLGRTSGLLGYFDNNKETEFLLPNGTFLETASDPERLHYEFGLKWAVDSNQSLFTYYGNRNHSFFSKTDFKPLLLDVRNLTFKDANLETEARRLCEDDMQCLFDALATGQPSFGLFSKSIAREYKRAVDMSMKKDCVPLSLKLENGMIERNDSKEGEIQYHFKCHPKFTLTGSSTMYCKNGIWNGTMPSCKGNDRKTPSHDPTKTIAILAACGTVVLAALAGGIVCIILKKRNRSSHVQRDNSNTAPETKQVGEENQSYIEMSTLDLAK